MVVKHKYCRDVAFFRTQVLGRYPTGELWSGWWITLNGTALAQETIEIKPSQLADWRPYAIPAV